MPTYDYQCKTCGHRFEYFQSISSDPLTNCPTGECPQSEPEKGKGEVKRRVSGGAGLLFKGEGFYQTDYVRKGDPATSTGTAKSESESAKSEGDSAGGSESGGSSGESGSSAGTETSDSSDS